MAPTGYLSLPLELRQKIVNDALEDAAEQDFALNTNVRLIENAVIGYTSLCSTKDANSSRPSAPHLQDGATILISVHHTIIDNIAFVLEQHLKTLEEDWARPSGWSLSKSRVYNFKSNIVQQHFVIWMSVNKLHHWSTLLKSNIFGPSHEKLKRWRAMRRAVCSIPESCYIQ
ncbi:hypothetical protein E2P81_ATG06945 [Venturia nashicola]|nr:hypothetical protein E2P81_ATG06945 [Venturia nashicola]